VNLQLVYPNSDTNEEMSFEELRAKARGWSDRDWATEAKHSKNQEAGSDVGHGSESLVDNVAGSAEPLMVVEDGFARANVDASQSQSDAQSSPSTQLDTTIAVNLNGDSKPERPKKMRIKEVKGETQTSMMDLLVYNKIEADSA